MVDLQWDTPYAPLNGLQQSSFAFVTLRDRLPVIITKTIDNLCRTELVSDKEKSEIVASLSKLKYELQSNKQLSLITVPLPCLSESEAAEDLEQWNSLISHFASKSEKSAALWFEVPWLFAECYLYRRIAESFSISGNDREDCCFFDKYDWFGELKQESFRSSYQDIAKVVKLLNGVTLNHSDAFPRDKLRYFILASLWGNQIDLSMAAGKSLEEARSGYHNDHLSAAETHLLVDDSERLLDHLHSLYHQRKQGRNTGVIHIVLDNAGAEFFMDLCLADYLLQCGLCESVVFHVKCYPWFVSDVTKADFAQLSTLLNSLYERDIDIFGNVRERWRGYLRDGKFICRQDKFWNGGVKYDRIACLAPELYRFMTTQDSLLWIFKGDLNYRKLVQDCQWPYPFTAPFSEALGDLATSKATRPPLVSLRTAKADVIVGLKPGVAENMNAVAGKNYQSQGWLVEGRYALIQLD